jgi:hypothetical protein
MIEMISNFHEIHNNKALFGGLFMDFLFLRFAILRKFSVTSDDAGKCLFKNSRGFKT